MANKQILRHTHGLDLEMGGRLEEIEICYHTYGILNEQASNAVWVCHALTANSDVFDWWPGLFGESDFYNPKQWFVVCANILGSCYGTTGPLSMKPNSTSKYYHSFPQLTARDLVDAHEILRKHLQIEKIHTLIGGSVGGFQILEWSIQNPNVVSNIILLATNAVSSPWIIAFNESQRLAIEADQTWKEDRDDAGETGLKCARSIALLSYRNAQTYLVSQSETNLNLADGFKASSYQRYQGDKLVNRFNAFSYFHVSKIMDSNNIGRNRGEITTILKSIKAKALVIGISSDILFPVKEQKFMAKYIPNAKYVEIDSLYGHDGFLIETEKIKMEIESFYNE